MKYRYLEDGEKVNIKTDQQKLRPFRNSWKPLSLNPLWCNGEKFYSSIHNPVRRPLDNKAIKSVQRRK